MTMRKRRKRKKRGEEGPMKRKRKGMTIRFSKNIWWLIVDKVGYLSGYHIAWENFLNEILAKI